MAELSTSDLARIYLGGWTPGDFARMEIRDNSVIVQPVRPPREREESKIVLPGQKTDEIPGTLCLLYRVIARGKQTRPEDIQVEIGDVVVVHNALSDPLHTNLEVLRIDARAIISRLKPGPHPVIADRIAAAADEARRFNELAEQAT